MVHNGFVDWFSVNHKSGEKSKVLQGVDIMYVVVGIQDFLQVFNKENILNKVVGNLSMK